MQILNLTQHPASAEQVAAGVVEPADKGAVQALLTFEFAPSPDHMAYRAQQLAEMAVAQGCTAAMIGGAPFFMGILERGLHSAGVEPLYSFSRREVLEMKQEDGSIKKTAVFRHVEFVRVF